MNFSRWASALPCSIPRRIIRRWKRAYRIMERIWFEEEHGDALRRDISNVFLSSRGFVQ